MSWQCDFIDHGIAIFPDGRIRPCCQTDSSYSKPLNQINNPNRFADLKNTDKPQACRKCWENEENGRPSYRRVTMSATTSNVKFLDLRHSNQCNLKCRYCHPHFSNQWAKELEVTPILQQTNIAEYRDELLTFDLEHVYWAGGEPLIMKDHYELIETMIAKGLSKRITLQYNTNLTVLQYKNIDIFSLWQHFKEVLVGISIDTAGPELNFIRSGSDWDQIKNHIDKLLQYQQHKKNLSMNFAVTLTMMSIWFLPNLIDYAQEKNIPISFTVLTGPDYLSLDAIPVPLQSQAKTIIESVKHHLTDSDYRWIMTMLSREDNEYLFLHAIRHILLLDKIRKESLFDLLPYKKIAIDLTVKNNEYQ
jgi:molybdenum cofactor biosynthesis enzyme MoaA